MITNILLILLLIGIGIILFKRKESPDNKNSVEENARLKADLSNRDKSIGQLTQDFQTEKTAKDQLSGKNKQLFIESTNLKAENTNIRDERDRLVKEISRFKAKEDSDKKEFDNNVEKLNAVNIALEDEKKRIRREDEERVQREKEERDRMWAEHEEGVKSKLAELCKMPQYAFQYYDNNNLPVGFGGRFKPDSLIEFLDQYVIFDAKVSESDLQNYINGNVKTTVEKINSNPKIYSTIFFVVPTVALKSLKKIRFYEQGYEFFVISPEAIEIILASFKKISSYDMAQQLDPRDRENIVNLIAEFDYHINMRNALDILASESGVSILKKGETLKHDIKEEIIMKKSKMRLQQFTPTDIKTLMLNTEVQKEKINELISPKVAIPGDNLENVRPVLGKKTKK